MRTRFLLIAALLLGIAAYYALFLRPITPADDISFTIPRGQSFAATTQSLKDAQLIRSPLAFRLYARITHLDSSVQAGNFLFPARTPISLPSLARTLKNAKAVDIPLTILEGWNSRDIDAYLTQKNLISAGTFTHSVTQQHLEGRLFPSTYFINPSTFTIDSLIVRMQSAMTDALSAAGYSPTLHPRPLTDYLTMASIVQLEEPDPTRMPLIADILWRRLNDNWQLGADATLFYITGHKHITAADLALDSPYNTRTHTGLPPTPVSMPGASALRAALFPEKNSYWYYLHDPAGAIHFATTNAEHEQNKTRYLR